MIPYWERVSWPSWIKLGRRQRGEAKGKICFKICSVLTQQRGGGGKMSHLAVKTEGEKMCNTFLTIRFFKDLE